VASLYVLVPSGVRKLDRDDDLHIKWRMFATSTVALLAILHYPLMICSLDVAESSAAQKPALALLGFDRSLAPVLRVLLHTCILYLGPSVSFLLYAHELVKRQERRGNSTGHLQVFRALCFDDLFIPFWQQLRNLLVAPALEEVVFRACISGPLSNAIESWTLVAWLAPLFFGSAHLHHAILKWKENQSLKVILFSTTLQFAYTSLFGAYVTHVFLRTASLPAIIVCHQYCNYMGLPDLSFLKPQFGRLSILYPQRVFLMGFYSAGVAGFFWGFGGILPKAGL
jgi:prenyl protein peptidase